jgi:hypothetical protein
MALFENGERVTPPSTRFCTRFFGLRSARAREDAIESFFAGVDAAFWVIVANEQPGQRGKRHMWHAAICSITRRTIEGRIHDAESDLDGTSILDLHRIINLRDRLDTGSLRRHPP